MSVLLQSIPIALTASLKSATMIFFNVSLTDYMQETSQESPSSHGERWESAEDRPGGVHH